ncbi:putative metal-dependent hydrolase [Fulvimarina pelagi HTCC2506]|uniref:Metal-dependent hydrolase n=2 Tax=Fulvimarina pelagi TaxID=217511 RepID=A0A0P0Z8S4_9HYPH|nr:MBL fold metallo-hydrolase [Fulvimarina pelagi]EAU41119.1 putative metal-dependent hydrolase [Fulvimarina pelagi HTCC2506]BAT30867.1 metal-dependent hydrolase [Fulvimarina pelagi]
MKRLLAALAVTVFAAPAAAQSDTEAPAAEQPRSESASPDGASEDAAEAGTTASGTSSSVGVKVTALGSHDGEFCARDRAMVFEDPNGTRILYDAGRTVAGANDERLGEIDVVLVSHVHGDHLGDQRIESVNAGTCDAPETNVSTTPNSNSVEIAVGKDAQMVTGSEMASFLGKKMEAAGGDPKASQLVRFGASVDVGGVAITTVPAVHSNGLSGDFIDGPLGEHLKTAGLNAYVGQPTGYVLTFSNGLSVYLSGDTGVTAEQETVVGQQYGVQLAVINIGDTYTTGPRKPPLSSTTSSSRRV